MKQIVFLLCLAFSFEMSAQKIIQTSFAGCELGKTSRTDVLINMAQIGATVNEYNRTAIVFSGVTEAENHSFSKVATAFVEDTLAIFILIETKENMSVAQVDSVKSKYSELPYTLKDNFLLSFIQDSIQTATGLDSTHIWSRLDDESAIAILEGDSVYAFVYVAADYIMNNRLVKLAEFVSQKFGPDYDISNKVNAVAGCTFGDTRQDVISKFRSKAESILDSDSHSITFSRVKFAGNYFKRGKLYFIDNKFVSCSFDTEYYIWRYEEAKSMYETLCYQFDKKYTNGRHWDSDKENMISYYGMVQSDYHNGYLPPISIMLNKGISRGGDSYYYVTVSYFYERIESLYNDEI